MKTFILSAALVATTAAFAAPAFAMENPVSESRARIEMILASQQAAPAANEASSVRATTFTEVAPVKLDRYEAAEARLFGSRSQKAGR